MNHNRHPASLLALAALLWMPSCDRSPPKEAEPLEVVEANGERAAAAARAERAARLEAERRACLVMRENIAALPALEGTPQLDEQRHRILGHAKGWPVVFRRPPNRDLDSLQVYFRVLAESLDDKRRAFSAFQTLRGRARHHRQQVRSILMPEGYLYAEDPELARWLVTHLNLERLFDEPEIWLMRGSEVHRLERSERGYRHTEGEQEGTLALLLLFDRVALTRAGLFPTLHVDFVPVATSYGFDRVRIQHTTPVGINASIRYGAESLWVDAVFTAEEGKAQLTCEIIPEKEGDRVAQFRKEQRLREVVAERLRKATDAQVREGLMFDEPREEVGQQDGSLRPLWLWAYRMGNTGYSFNKIWYPVFDHQGRPHLPQVCIDFVLDTYERASGTWYGKRDAPRERSSGTIDFDRFEMPNRRSVEAVANFFRDNPGTFAIWDLSPEQRIRFAQRSEFYDFLRDNADQFRVNNVVSIHGPRGGEAHYHSVIVSQTDPITGMPVEVSENAGKPRYRSWHAATQSGPLRSIRNVMIPELDWLREVLVKETDAVALANDDPKRPSLLVEPETDRTLSPN